MANKIFKGLKFPGMDDYYVLPEAVISKNEDGIIEIESMIASDANVGTDASLSTSGMAADAAAVGNALLNKASESFVLAKIAEAQLEDSDVDLSGYLTKENPAGVGSFSMNRKVDSTIGTNSTTFGHNNVASGYASHAEGFKTTASGQGAHAEGQETTTSSLASHAEGLNTTASEQSAHAEGWLTTAAGQASHAEGYSTQANADSSHAEGLQTIAASRWQHVQGKYNIEDASGTYAHIVGNGDSSARSNAHTLDWDGNAWFAGAIDCEDTVTTLANLGAAPAKFGLNNDFVTTTNAADFDGYKTNGWYRYVNNNAQTLVPGFNVYYAVVRVDSYSYNDYIVQTMYPMNYPSCTLRRYYHLSYGTWSKWAWENPPLNNDVEYFTTELIKNVQIYKKKDSATGKIQYRIAGEGTWNDYAGLLGQTDYVVANGTSGVWSYWKFNSGLCIAMGQPTVTWGTQTQVITGQYRSGTALDLTGIFTAVMGGTCSNVHRYVNCFVIPSGSTSAELWATTAASAGAELYSKTPRVVLFGKWK